MQNCILAVIFIANKNLTKFCLENQLNENDPDLVEKKFIERFDQIAKEKKFNGLQKIKGLIIEAQSLETLDLQTTSFKKKRHMIQERYKERFARIYSKLNK